MELHDAVIYGFPYKLRPKPKIATAVSSRNAVWEREYRYLVSDSDLGTEMSMLDHVIV